MFSWIVFMFDRYLTREQRRMWAINTISHGMKSWIISRFAWINHSILQTSDKRKQKVLVIDVSVSIALASVKACSIDSFSRLFNQYYFNTESWWQKGVDDQCKCEEPKYCHEYCIKSMKSSSFHHCQHITDIWWEKEGDGNWCQCEKLKITTISDKRMV